MKKNEPMNIFGAVLITPMVLVNLCHLLWTYTLVAEQIKTGWGFGTNMEMMMLAPWMTELICLPVMVAGVVYLVLSCFKRHHKGLMIANLALFSCAVAQFVVTNLFAFY